MERKLLFVRVEYIFGRELDYIRLDERMKGRGRKKNGWKNYKEFGNGDGEGIVSAFQVLLLFFFFFLLFLSLSPFAFPRKERESVRKYARLPRGGRRSRFTKPLHSTSTSTTQ